MDLRDADMNDELRQLIEQNRARCLWYIREDFYTQTAAEILRTLDRIQRCGDLDAFRRAGKIKQWLLQNSSEASAK